MEFEFKYLEILNSSIVKKKVYQMGSISVNDSISLRSCIAVN